jgi:hypothetical protein
MAINYADSVTEIFGIETLGQNQMTLGTEVHVLPEEEYLKAYIDIVALGSTVAQIRRRYQFHGAGFVGLHVVRWPKNIQPGWPETLPRKKAEELVMTSIEQQASLERHASRGAFRKNLSMVYAEFTGRADFVPIDKRIGLTPPDVIFSETGPNILDVYITPVQDERILHPSTPPISKRGRLVSSEIA